MLIFRDHRQDPATWARALGISTEAVSLYLQSDVIDLHTDSFIWDRVFGFDLSKRHGRGLFGARWYSQVDFPRILEAQVSGATWIITTNPGRSAPSRQRTLLQNIERLRSLFAQQNEQFSVVTNVSEYRQARSEGKHAAFVGIQGGHATGDDVAGLDLLPRDLILRITLVHLSSSVLGETSSPLKATSGGGLTNVGRDYVRALNHKKIFVDLAHISRQGFFDAVAVHDKTKPLLVTHTGVSGVFEHWRNLDDAQIRAIADTGGTIGVMYHSGFLGDSYWGGKVGTVVDHMAHIVQLVGDDHVSLGSDWDGAIITPRDMPTCLELPRLVQNMLDRGWRQSRIQKILGGNFLRVVGELRP